MAGAIASAAVYCVRVPTFLALLARRSPTKAASASAPVAVSPNLVATLTLKVLRFGVLHALLAVPAPAFDAVAAYWPLRILPVHAGNWTTIRARVAMAISVEMFKDDERLLFVDRLQEVPVVQSQQVSARIETITGEMGFLEALEALQATLGT